MYSKRNVVVAVVAIVSMALVATVGTAAGNKSEFEGTNTYTGLTALGTWRCPGGEPVPPFSCPPGTQTHVRGAGTAASFYSPDTGPAALAIVANANYNPDFTGELWGTWTVVFSSAGSTCEGSWNGSVRKAGNNYVNLIRAIAFCAGGNFDGFQVKWNETAVGINPATSSVTGRFLDPGED